MPKVISRNVISQSKEDEIEKDPNKALSIHYCLCGEFLLVLEGPLHALPRRPIDGAYALRNEGTKKKVYKLNANSNDPGVLLRRGKEFEYQKPLKCTRCRLQVGYETTQEKKGPATFILPGGLTDQQSVVPDDAYGPDEI